MNHRFTTGRAIPFLIIALTALGSLSLRKNNGVHIGRMRCEMRENPAGIDTDTPRLSWELHSDERSVHQTGYRILVASSEGLLARNRADKWDSGWVSSDESVGIDYAGAPLASREECFWKVQVRTDKGRTEWSQPARWSVALLDSTEWKARWIGIDSLFTGEQDTGQTRLAARYLRREFRVTGQVRRATLYICGLGLYEAFLNGQRIGSQELAPAPTDYDRSVRYNTFDITDALNEGDNALGVVLGNGRYFSMRNPGIRHFGFPKLLLQAEIEYADGSRRTITSDTSWRLTARGPIRANSEFDGEEYDARLEMPGWDRPGFDDTGWMQAREVGAPAGRLLAQANPNIRPCGICRPTAIRELRPGVHILDMGENMVGWLAMRRCGEPGDTIRLRFAETLNPDGALYTANLRSARATDCYIPDGRSDGWWEPTFTYHGFRYVEISGYPGTPRTEDFEGRILCDEMELTGRFATSDSTINRIYRNAVRGIRGNYRGMPTDCPQRDERMGWLGDRTVGSLGESFVFDNDLLYAKWLQDIEETQLGNGAISDVAPNYWTLYNDDVTWPSAYIVIARTLYEQFGDRRPIDERYASMKRWMDHMRRDYMRDGIISRDTYGDWCMPPEAPELIHSQDPARKTDGALLSTATFYQLSGIMSDFARLTGHETDAREFALLADTLREAYNRRFFDPATKSYGNNTVTANLLSLAYGLVPEGAEEEVFAHIVAKTLNDCNGHVSTGLVGIQQLMRGLTRHGRPDIAFRLATNRDYPSWGYMVEQGATTIWELWNGDTADPAMNSGNHVMLLGDLIVWYYECLAGIRNAPGSTAFSHILMEPCPVEGLDRVEASFRSPRGRIVSNWRKAEGRFEWEVVIPANCRATLGIPCSDPASVLEGGREAARADGVRFAGSSEGRARFEIGSGYYRFSVPESLINPEKNDNR